MRSTVSLTQSMILGLLAGCALACLSVSAEASDSSDTQITSWIREALRLDPRVESMEVGVETHDGIVTLSGVVSNLGAKDYAVAEAKKISGVRGVVDDVVVSSTLLSDLDILENVNHRLASSSIVGPGVTAKSVEGTVTLSGWVRSWSEADVARLLASNVPGVRAVESTLEVRWRGARTDQEIRLDVLRALKRDAYLTGLPIDVAVESGAVTLSGIVGSLSQRDRATRKALLIANVNRVENDLNVFPNEARGVRLEELYSTDPELLGALTDEFAQDGRLKGSEIQPVVASGHVTLEGYVPSHHARRVAEEDARDVVGVAWVTNDLITRVESREDERIADDVKRKLASDQHLDGAHIVTTVRDGIVTLTGDVDRWYQRSHVADAVSKVLGVRDVIDRLRVDSSRQMKDLELIRRIKLRLAWDWLTRPIEERIRVDVTGDVATLTGVVNTWAERREAERLALTTDGIWRVHNTLSVKGYAYRWDDWLDELPDASDGHYYGPLDDSIS